MTYINNGQSIKLIKSCLLEDCIEPKQAEKIYNSIEEFYTVKKEEKGDEKLKAVLDILAQSSKWRLTYTGLETGYAVPVLDDKYNVLGVEYKPNKSFIIPEELWSRYTN